MVHNHYCKATTANTLTHMHNALVPYAYPISKTVLVVTLISRIINIYLSQILIHLEQQTQNTGTPWRKLNYSIITSVKVSLTTYHDVLAVERQARYLRLHGMQKFHSTRNIQSKTQCLILIDDNAFNIHHSPLIWRVNHSHHITQSHCL